jgi:high-affinity nickel-transport protein
MSAPANAPLTRGEWTSIVMMSVVVVGLTVVGWGLLVLLVAPQDYHVTSTQVFGVGLGLTAYTLGMRHAFDADHIAAIDNTTRKLMADGKRPVSVGFWFSLGHSTIVFTLCVLLAFGVRALAGQVQDDSSRLHDVTGLIGTTVSGVFLLVIGVLNLIVLRQILKVFRAMRRGEYDEAELDEQLSKRGLMNRFLGGATKAVTKPWHMYPVGVLFGLGFDTATEVALLATTALLAAGALARCAPDFRPPVGDAADRRIACPRLRAAEPRVFVAGMVDERPNRAAQQHTRRLCGTPSWRQALVGRLHARALRHGRGRIRIECDDDCQCRSARRSAGG